ncbi:hypothetical protein J4E91_008079 [Alternaria rosae]|nr:hypothetical protein J4E91_008079 [Alternaria rosae]
MSTLAKSLSHVLFSTRYAYQFTSVHSADLIEQECWICLRSYFTQDEDDEDKGDARPECLPIKLPCGHVVGQNCFDHYRRATDDVEQCLLCRQKLLPLAPRVKFAAWLHRVCRTPWFQWHDRKLGWTPFGVEDVEASSSEVRMYNGQVLTWHDTLTTIVHDEATRAYLYITIPILTLACLVAVACLTYQRFGNTPPSYVAVKDPALYDPYGRHSYGIWERFPELMLLYDITTENATYDRAHDGFVVMPVVLFVLSTIAFTRLTYETHFPNSMRE